MPRFHISMCQKTGYYQVFDRSGLGWCSTLFKSQAAAIDFLQNIYMKYGRII